MSKKKQRSYFSDALNFIKNNLVKGGFDNKTRMKYLMRFLKIAKPSIFCPNIDSVPDKVWNLYFQIKKMAEKFINELRGIDKIKEDDFLNMLSHKEQIIFIDVINETMNALDLSIFMFQDKSLEYEEHTYQTRSDLRKLIANKNKIEKIIGSTLPKVTKQENTNLKIFSRTFRKKAAQYRKNSRLFLLGVVIPLVTIVFLAKFSNFFDYKIEFPPPKDADSTAFYIYFISKILFSGRLLFAITTLTGFFYCLRFYAANQHNAIICDQRANTLEAFEPLYENVTRKVVRRGLSLSRKFFNLRQSICRQGLQNNKAIAGEVLTFLLLPRF